MAEQGPIGLAGVMRKNTRTLTTSLAVTAAALLLVGCAAGDPTVDPVTAGNGTGATTEPAPGGTTGTGDGAPGEVDGITAAALAAIDLAEADSGGVAFELDDEDDSSWKIDLAVGGTEVEAVVNWAGTELLSSRDEGSVDGDDRRKLDAATVTIQEAITIAAERAGGHVTDVELSTENGVIVWDVEFDDGPDDWEIHVDVRTGEVVKAERD